MGSDIHIPAGEPLRLCCLVSGASGKVLRLVSGDGMIETDITDDPFEVQWDVLVDRDTYWRPEVIEPPEVPLDREPAALMALALGNPIYVMVD